MRKVFSIEIGKQKTMLTFLLFCDTLLTTLNTVARRKTVFLKTRWWTNPERASFAPLTTLRASQEAPLSLIISRKRI